MRMSKDNKSQILILIFLIVCSFSLTIGFAAFLSNLTINSSIVTGSLNGIIFENAAGHNVTKYCTPKNGSSNSATSGYTKACDDITIKKSIGSLVSNISNSLNANDINDATGVFAD